MIRTEKLTFNLIERQSRAGKSISRAIAINFPEFMREIGVLKGVEGTGKGDNQWIYGPVMTEAKFKQYIARTTLESLMRSFLEEIRMVLENLEPQRAHRTNPEGKQICSNLIGPTTQYTHGTTLVS